MRDMGEFLERSVRESGLPFIVLDRLRREYPEREWSFIGEFALVQGELFLHFADSAERRMWWVMVEEEWSGETPMTWDMGEISDLV